MSKSTLTIANWNETFECASTRKRQRLKCFLSPSGCDSYGYEELADHGIEGFAALGVFQALCQLSATFRADQRGKFVRSNGEPIPADRIARKIQIKQDVFDQAVALLEQVGWLQWVEALPSEVQQPAQQELMALPDPEPESVPKSAKKKPAPKTAQKTPSKPKKRPVSALPPADRLSIVQMDALVAEIVAETKTLKADGSWRPELTAAEMSAIAQNRDSFACYDWQLVRDWLKSNPERPPHRRLAFFEGGGQSETSRALEWQRTRKKRNGSSRRQTSLPDWKKDLVKSKYQQPGTQ